MSDEPRWMCARLKMVKRKKIPLATILHFFLPLVCFSGINHSHVHSFLRSVQPSVWAGNWLHIKVLVLSLVQATRRTPTIKCISEECKSSSTGVKHNWAGLRAGERYQNWEHQTEIIMNLTVSAFCGHRSKNSAIRDGMRSPVSSNDYYAPRKQEVFAPLTQTNFFFLKHYYSNSELMNVHISAGRRC